jgi:hypothetical protein
MMAIMQMVTGSRHVGHHGMTDQMVTGNMDMMAIKV